MIPIMCRTSCKIKNTSSNLIKKIKLHQVARFSTNAVNCGVAGDVVTANLTKGIDHLRNPRLNKDTNETLFYCLIHDDVEKYMPLINSPTVGIACLRFGLVYKRSRGLFVTIHDKGHVIDVLKNWPERDVRVVVVTDGERILGLGDLGAHGMGVAQGKITLMTALGGIKPHQCLPVCLDVGTNNTSLIEDPLYIGIREARYPRKDYDDLVCEFFAACKKLYGPQTLIMMEDLAMQNAYRLLTRFRDDYCVFNDDIQATAATVLSGLMVACNRITNQKLKDNTYLFFGAGSTGVGIANLLCDAMMEEGLTSEAARNRCYLFDIDGLLARERRAGIPAHAKDFARDLEPETDFQACIKKFKATCIIGTSTSGSAFTPSILREVAKNAERPLIFPLSNPTIQSECSAQEAYDYTQGKKFYPGQANNYYIFPGIALGVVTANAFRVTDDMFITAAKTLARNVTEEDIKVGRIYPHVNQMNNISLSIAAEIVSLACDLNLTYLCPRPSNYEEFVREQSYEFKYSTNIPRFYSYPEKSIIKLKNIEVLHKGLLPRKRRPRPRSDPPILV
ncbi:hypothetical protein SFRURICE_020243 [Spodoptera frugiperda]|nr:hypothetical protein SFRURICE_020243 [Spodoptera frugiperda]